jgi:hypothetical protein
MPLSWIHTSSNLAYGSRSLYHGFTFTETPSFPRLKELKLAISSTFLFGGNLTK